MGEAEKAALAAQDKQNTDAMNTSYHDLEAHMKDYPAQLAYKHASYKELVEFEAPVMKRHIKSHAKKVYCAQWAEDSTHIVTAGQDGNVCVTNATKSLITKLPIRSPFVMQCAYNMKKDIVACGGMNNLVDIHKFDANGRPSLKKSFVGHEGYISGLIFLDGGGKLLSSSGDGSVILWDLNQMTMISQFWGHEADVSGAQPCVRTTL